MSLRTEAHCAHLTRAAPHMDTEMWSAFQARRRMPARHSAAASSLAANIAREKRSESRTYAALSERTSSGTVHTNTGMNAKARYHARSVSSMEPARAAAYRSSRQISPASGEDGSAARPADDEKEAMDVSSAGDISRVDLNPDGAAPPPKPGRGGFLGELRADEGADDASDTEGGPGGPGGAGGGPRAPSGGDKISAAVIWSRLIGATRVSPPSSTPSVRVALRLLPAPPRGDQSTRNLRRRPARSPSPEGTAPPAAVDPSSMTSPPSPTVVTAMATPAANLSAGPRTGATGVRGT
mmetsp:Transcript_9216/g.37168  ORF Transcript_9216/g.37168 Transcript_9216/m.37168 type:complete len:296 (+) Transcript_9216:1398-2285(+)